MNTNITTTSINSKSSIDNDDKCELYYEKLQFQLQMQQERDKFNLEKEKFNVEKEAQNEKFKVEQDKLQVKQDKFALEKQQFQHDMKNEKQQFQHDMQSEQDKFSIEKEKFAIEKQQYALEKQQFAIEKLKFEEQCEQHTSQLFHHNSLSTFSMIPQTPTIPSPMLPSLSQQHHQQTEQQPQQEEQAEHPDNCNNTFIESNLLLNQHAKVLASVKESIIDYGVQNAELVDKAMRNLKRRARLLDKKEADVNERSEKLKPYEQDLQELRSENGQLRSENDELKKELEPVRKAEQERIEKERIEKERIEKERIAKQCPLLKPIFDTNVSSFGDQTNLQMMLITIQNLNKTIHIHFYPRKSLIETLWSDSTTALFSILKNDWANGKIPKVLDNTVKLFVSSKDVLINGKKEWIQISGDGVESSLPPPYTTQITTQSLLKYTGSCQYQQTFDNDRCQQGTRCAQRNNPNCSYHCGKKNDIAENCDAAHQSTTQLYNAYYHIKLKWC